MTPEDHSGGPVHCDQLGRFVDGELAVTEAAAFRRHLIVCARCQQEMHGLMQLSALAEQSQGRAPAARPDLAPAPVGGPARATPSRGVGRRGGRGGDGRGAGAGPEVVTEHRPGPADAARLARCADRLGLAERCRRRAVPAVPDDARWAGAHPPRARPGGAPPPGQRRLAAPRDAGPPPARLQPGGGVPRSRCLPRRTCSPTAGWSGSRSSATPRRSSTSTRRWPRPRTSSPRASTGPSPCRRSSSPSPRRRPWARWRRARQGAGPPRRGRTTTTSRAPRASSATTTRAGRRRAGRSSSGRRRRPPPWSEPPEPRAERLLLRARAGPGPARTSSGSGLRPRARPGDRLGRPRVEHGHRAARVDAGPAGARRGMPGPGPRPLAECPGAARSTRWRRTRGAPGQKDIAPDSTRIPGVHGLRREARCWSAASMTRGST